MTRLRGKGELFFVLSCTKSCSFWHVQAGLTLPLMVLSVVASGVTQVVFTLTVSKCGLILFTSSHWLPSCPFFFFFLAEELFVDNSLY